MGYYVVGMDWLLPIDARKDKDANIVIIWSGLEINGVCGGQQFDFPFVEFTYYTVHHTNI